MNVLLVADRKGWAYDILAQSLKKHLVRHSVSIKYVVDIRSDLTTVDFTPYDVVYFFLWFDAMRYGPSIKGFDFSKTCVGIHSLASWKKRNLDADEASEICNRFAAAGYISEEIHQSMNLHRGFGTPNGIDGELFRPAPLPGLDELRFMWVGNPGKAHHGDNKGFFSHIKPVADEFGLNISLATPDSPVPRESMGDFYASNHVLLCMSEHEGGPMPIVEALASGRPVVTTDVGIVREIVVDGENGYIIERSQEALRQCIQRIVEDPGRLRAMSKKAPLAVKDRFEQHMSAKYERMFDFVNEFDFNRGLTLQGLKKLKALWRRAFNKSGIKRKVQLTTKRSGKASLTPLRVFNSDKV